MQHRAPAMVAMPLPARMRASLLAHLAAWLAVGGAWQGPVSYRKPTTFVLSFGLTTITLAWVSGHLRLTDPARWLLLGPLALADTYEVAWVSVQRWRGVASHFNDTTPLDELLFVLGAAAVTVTITVILILMVLAFTAMQATPAMALAIRAGLLILLVAQGVGGWMLSHGLGVAEQDTTVGLTTFGAGGVMKVPHAVAMHAIQVLPALAWLLGFAAVGERRRLALVAGKVATGRPGLGRDTYAYGFADTRINRVRIVGHNGGSPGYEGQPGRSAASTSARTAPTARRGCTSSTGGAAGWSTKQAGGAADARPRHRRLPAPPAPQPDPPPVEWEQQHATISPLPSTTAA